MLCWYKIYIFLIVFDNFLVSMKNIKINFLSIFVDFIIFLNTINKKKKN